MKASMDSYYPDYLFHFTGRNQTPEKSCEILLDIVENGLKFNWNEKESLEYMETLPREIRRKVVAPVVCLTEIPLEHIYPHTLKYGKFGIGLSKEWAIRNHAQPVIYLDRNHMGFGEGLRILLEQVGDEERVDHALRYIVPFFRELEYHEEREWRLISLLSGKKREDVREKKYLPFQREDIRNVVAPEEYLQRLKEGIRNIFGRRYGDATIHFQLIPFEKIINKSEEGFL